ncbi:collagen alpha-1(I) chain-like [Eublepharis macularius]|uniref:Collagen alpha-1(I) chain-like n=1 Tax=Eublepharis macularius TaxID=481883 RepID=A0AA97LGM1_EUBMA|nr:collagen alpha-1(I) chain-like [Eublepharis macularius]
MQVQGHPGQNIHCVASAMMLSSRDSSHVQRLHFSQRSKPAAIPRPPSPGSPGGARGPTRAPKLAGSRPASPHRGGPAAPALVGPGPGEPHEPRGGGALGPRLGSRNGTSAWAQAGKARLPSPAPAPVRPAAALRTGGTRQASEKPPPGQPGAPAAPRARSSLPSAGAWGRAGNGGKPSPPPPPGSCSCSRAGRSGRAEGRPPTAIRGRSATRPRGKRPRGPPFRQAHAGLRPRRKQGPGGGGRQAPGASRWPAEKEARRAGGSPRESFGGGGCMGREGARRRQRPRPTARDSRWAEPEGARPPMPGCPESPAEGGEGKGGAPGGARKAPRGGRGQRKRVPLGAGAHLRLPPSGWRPPPPTKARPPRLSACATAAAANGRPPARRPPPPMGGPVGSRCRVRSAEPGARPRDGAGLERWRRGGAGRGGAGRPKRSPDGATRGLKPSRLTLRGRLSDAPRRLDGRGAPKRPPGVRRSRQLGRGTRAAAAAAATPSRPASLGAAPRRRLSSRARSASWPRPREFRGSKEPRPFPAAGRRDPPARGGGAAAPRLRAPDRGRLLRPDGRSPAGRGGRGRCLRARRRPLLPRGAGIGRAGRSICRSPEGSLRLSRLPGGWKGPGGMSSSGIHRGHLRKYGGFLFKQWKEKFLSLSPDGSLLICPNAGAPAELGISLGTSCDAILDGSEICDLPRLPLGAQRDSCLGLSLNDGRSLLFLAPNTQECRQWLNILRKVKESFSRGSPSSCKVHINLPARKCCRKGGAGARGSCRESPGLKRPEAARTSLRQEPCLRHSSLARARVQAACLLVGGAAAGPTMGYMVTSAHAGPSTESHPPDFKELGYHPAACDTESQYEALDYEGMDQDFDVLEFGGFGF